MPTIADVAALPHDHELKLVAADWYEDSAVYGIAAALRWMARRKLAPCYFTLHREQDHGKEWAWVSAAAATGDRDEELRLKHSGGHISAALHDQRHALIPHAVCPCFVWEFPTCEAAFDALIARHIQITEALR